MRKLAAGFSLVTIAIAAWSALWFYGAHEAGVRFDAWLKAEDQQGRSWTCPDRAIGGFPFALTVSCTKPTYTGRAPDQVVHGEAAGLVADASLAHPQKLIVTLQAPLAYRTSDLAVNLKATWSSLTVAVPTASDAKSLTLNATDVAITQTDRESGVQSGKAADLDATFIPLADGALDFSIVLKGAPVAQLDALIGGQTPVDLDLTGHLDHANTLQGPTPDAAIEAWRQAGGRVTLAQSRLSRADSSVSGSGILALDDAHRLQGRLDASFVGLEPVLKRYGISGNLAAAGSLLNSLFGGGKPAPETQSVPGALNLPISFQAGRLGVGPIRTQIALPPLY